MLKDDDTANANLTKAGSQKVASKAAEKKEAIFEYGSGSRNGITTF